MWTAEDSNGKWAGRACRQLCSCAAAEGRWPVNDGMMQRRTVCGGYLSHLSQHTFCSSCVLAQTSKEGSRRHPKICALAAAMHTGRRSLATDECCLAACSPPMHAVLSRAPSHYENGPQNATHKAHKHGLTRRDTHTAGKHATPCNLGKPSRSRNKLCLCLYKKSDESQAAQTHTRLRMPHRMHEHTSCRCTCAPAPAHII